METVLLQINNQKAYRLLEDLEDLQIIKVLNKSIQPKKKPSDFFGTLSEEEGEKFQAYITQSRNEWERNF
jgi:hypothetical protein